MRRKFVFRLLLASVLAVLLLWHLVAYRPPLLAGPPDEPVGMLRVAVGFAWWYTLAVWRQTGWDRRPDPVAAARAAWYRPSLCRELTGIDPGDRFQLARHYHSLGLVDSAAALFRSASGRGAARSAYLALLEDWEGVLEVCAGEEFAGKDYWAGRAWSALGRPDQALASFGRLPRMPDALARAGEILEPEDPNKARDLYRRALELDTFNRVALEGMICWGDYEERESAARKLARRRPEIELNLPIGNRFILLGTGAGPERIGTRGRTVLEVYLLGWWRSGEEEKVLPRAVLENPVDPYPLSLGWREEEIPPPGGLARIVLTWSWPLEISPGRVALGLEFLDLPGRDLIPIQGEGTTAPVAEVELFPRWVEAELVPPLEEARVFPISTWLGPGDRLRLELDDPVTAEVVMVGSGCRHRGSPRRGTEMGEILLETASGRRYVFPLREGLEVADFRPGRMSGSRPSLVEFAIKAENGAVLHYPEFRLPAREEVTALEAANLSRSSGLRLEGMAFASRPSSGGATRNVSPPPPREVP